MTADELAEFIAGVRAECDAALADLDAIDPAALPPDLRAEYDFDRQRWIELRALTEDDAVALHVAAAEHAGRELTQEESRAIAVSRAQSQAQWNRPERPDGMVTLDGYGSFDPIYGPEADWTGRVRRKWKPEP